MELIASSPPKAQAYGPASARVCREKRTDMASWKVGATMTSPSAVSTALTSLFASASSFSGFPFGSLKELVGEAGAVSVSPT